MRSFSYVSLVATLVCAAFTSAAPVAVGDLPVAVPALPETPALQARCAGCDLLKGVIASIQTEVDAVDALTEPVTAEVLSLNLNKVITIVTTTTETIKEDAQSLVGLAVSDVVTLLCDLLRVVYALVIKVLALVASLSVSDVTNIKGLVATLLCAVGDLLCLVLSVVGALLGNAGAIIAQVISAVVQLPVVGELLTLVDGVIDHFPLGLGGVVPVQDIISLAGGLVGGVLKAIF